MERDYRTDYLTLTTSNWRHTLEEQEQAVSAMRPILLTQRGRPALMLFPIGAFLSLPERRRLIIAGQRILGAMNAEAASKVPDPQEIPTFGLSQLRKSMAQVLREMRMHGTGGFITHFGDPFYFYIPLPLEYRPEILDIAQHSIEVFNDMRKAFKLP